MKTKTKLTGIFTLAAIGCSIGVFALIDQPELLREKWGGWTIEKSVNDHNQITRLYTAINAGIGSPMARISHSSRFPWDGIGLAPLPEEIKEHYVLFRWWGDNRKASGGFIQWTHFSGAVDTLELPPGSFGAAPDDVERFWGLEESVDGRVKKLGGFDYGFKNVGYDFERVRVDIEWDATELDWGHTTTHRKVALPGETHRIYPVPESQNFGRALTWSVRLEDK